MKPRRHEEHKQHTFDAFVKKVLRNELLDYLDETARRGKHEITFSALPVEAMEQLSIRDKYFTEDRTFSVLEFSVYIDNEELAEAVASLSREKRDTILLSFFLGMSDYEIARRTDVLRRTVTYRRTSTLKLLKKMMGGHTDD